jgi:mRNA-degrading endonuclease toxin of MazEF toxin-antitoxin module
VIVVSRDAMNVSPTWRSIVVVPLSTSKAQARRGRTAVPIPKGSGGLQREGVALCHQVTTLDRSKLLKRLGMLDREILAQVEDGLRVTLEIETRP